VVKQLAEPKELLIIEQLAVKLSVQSQLLLKKIQRANT